MRRLKILYLGICLWIAASAVTISVVADSTMIQRIATGPWGGDHIHIEVESTSASINFDCAHGTIEGSLSTDAKGQFSWKGSYSREHGGPVRNDEVESKEDAIYSGSINGQTMKLTVRLANQDQPLDSFVLTQGKHGRIRKCL